MQKFKEEKERKHTRSEASGPCQNLQSENSSGTEIEEEKREIPPD
jgi:hypothetical protein